MHLTLGERLEVEQAIAKHGFFASMLGMTADQAEALRHILLEVIQTHDARLGRHYEFGQR